MRVYDVNLVGVCYGIRLAIHVMKRQVGGGCIIAIVSANVYLTQPSSAFYDASKHVVLGLVCSTAQRANVLTSHIWLARWHNIPGHYTLQGGESADGFRQGQEAVRDRSLLARMEVPHI